MIRKEKKEKLLALFLLSFTGRQTGGKPSLFKHFIQSAAEPQSFSGHGEIILSRRNGAFGSRQLLSSISIKVQAVLLFKIQHRRRVGGPPDQPAATVSL